MLKPTSVKFPPELLLELKTLARKEGRSVSNLVIYIIRNYLERKKDD